jgi:hypothetical protein
MVELVGRYNLVSDSLGVELDSITSGCDLINVEVANNELVLVVHSHFQLRGQRPLLRVPSLARGLLTYRCLKSVISVTSRPVVEEVVNCLVVNLIHGSEELELATVLRFELV